LRNPITGIAGCCARAASGHVLVATALLLLLGYPTHPFQLFLQLGTMLNQHFINPHSQVHECFDVHP
jgi:hypothetical protein